MDQLPSNKENENDLSYKNENFEDDSDKVMDEGEEEEDLNLDELFNLSYSFDKLKNALASIIENQRIVNSRLDNLEQNLGVSNPVINDAYGEEGTGKNTRFQMKIKMNNVTHVHNLTNKHNKGLNRNLHGLHNKYSTTPGSMQNIGNNQIVQSNAMIPGANMSNNMMTPNAQSQGISQTNSQGGPNMPLQDYSNNSGTRIDNPNMKYYNQGTSDNISSNQTPIPGDTSGDYDDDILSKNTRNMDQKQHKNLISLLKNYAKIEKVSSLERKVADLVRQNNSLTDKNKSLERQLQDLNDDYRKTAKNVEEFKTKLREMGIMTTDSGQNKTEELLAGMVNTLETKTQQKFNFIDAKVKKLEENSLKSKNDVTNFKNLSEFLQNAVNQLKEDSIVKEQNTLDSKNEFEAKLEKMKKEFNDSREKLINAVKKINTSINTINEGNTIRDNEIKHIEEFSKSISGTQINETEFNNLKDVLYKTIPSLEKKVCHSENAIKDITFIKDNLENLKNTCIQSYATKNEFGDLKYTLYKLEEKIKDFNDIIIPIMDDIGKFKANNGLFIKKIEEFNNSLCKLSSNVKNITKLKLNEPIDSSSTQNDLSGYLSVETFQTFIKNNYNKDHDILKKEINELNILLSQSKLDISNKVDQNDLKSLEEYLLGEVQELKSILYKRYLEKFEFTKSFKFLDLKIKSIIEILLSNGHSTETPQSCLIAKKPMGGYVCASCENYIGELGQINDPQVVEKLISPKTNEQNAGTMSDIKIGNGFSKILSLLPIKDNGKKEGNEKEENGKNNLNLDPKCATASMLNPLCKSGSVGNVQTTKRASLPKLVKNFSKNDESRNNNKKYQEIYSDLNQEYKTDIYEGPNVQTEDDPKM